MPLAAMDFSTLGNAAEIGVEKSMAAMADAVASSTCVCMQPLSWFCRTLWPGMLALTFVAAPEEFCTWIWYELLPGLNTKATVTATASMPSPGL